MSLLRSISRISSSSSSSRHGMVGMLAVRFFSSSAAATASPSTVTRPGRLSGSVALITGAGAGIGRETALLFASEAPQGVVCVDRSIENASSVAEEINKLYGKGKAIAIQADVSKENDIKKMIEQAEKTYGKLNVIFNNAGIMHNDDDNAMTTSEAVWDLTFNVNVKSVFFGCKYGIPALKRAGGGSIINTASFVAKMGAATPQLAYTSSKGAVLAMTRELAIIHARENIRVNALCPGPLKTKLLMDFLNTEEKKKRRLVHLPMGRFGEAKEMASAALFLASNDSSYITGSDFLVDGGLCAAYVTPE